MATIEKIRKKDNYVNVNMKMVKVLKELQEKMGCNLKPKRSNLCDECGNYTICHKHKWERKFLSKRDRSKYLSRRRLQKKESQNKKFYEEKIYICDPFDFCCPFKEECDGLNCIIVDES